MPKAKTNHVCKYSGCTLGENGSRKEYYACDYCDRVNSWRSMACCKEHYDLYIKEILEARSKDTKPVPERTDKSKDEIDDMYKKSIDEVRAESEKELETLTGEKLSSIEAAVDKVNSKNNPPKQRRNKK